MSDEIPDSAAGAVRAFLGALGFIVALIGAEMIAEKGGERIWAGVVLIAASLPIFLSAFMWRWLRQKLGKIFADRLVAIANDPRWWLISFFLALFSMRLAIFAVDFPRIAAGMAALLIVFLTWGYFSTRNKPLAKAETATAPVAHALDRQTHLDLSHLLDFAVTETTYWMLDRLLEAADSPAVTDGFKDGPYTEEAHQSRQFFIGYARQEIGAGTFRYSEYQNAIHGAELEAERELQETPQDQRPAGIDLLALRRYMISERQFRRAIQLIRNERREVRERLVAQRHRLIELYQQREEANRS